MNTLSQFFLWNNPKPFANSYEEMNREEKASLFPYSFSMYNNNSCIFELVRSSFILEGISNKRYFDYLVKNFSDEQLKYNKDILYKNLKYFIFNGQKIYLPFFSKEINEIYSNELYNLRSSKYNEIIKNEKKYYINPFDYYKFYPYNSLFTRLILISNCKNSYFFYHIEFETIIIIDDNGYLENEFPLFDEKCEKDKQNLFERLSQVSNEYYLSSDNFLNSLIENRLISNSFYKMCKTYLLKKNKKKYEKL